MARQKQFLCPKVPLKVGLLFEKEKNFQSLDFGSLLLDGSHKNKRIVKSSDPTSQQAGETGETRPGEGSGNSVNFEGQECADM